VTTGEAKRVEEVIDRMWNRAEDGMERAVVEAPTTDRWKSALTFQRGFYFAMALMARERQTRERANIYRGNRTDG
jgi:hypothetical protein